jgi:hypothetical protein
MFLLQQCVAGQVACGIDPFIGCWKTESQVVRRRKLMKWPRLFDGSDLRPCLTKANRPQHDEHMAA